MTHCDTFTPLKVAVLTASDSRSLEQDTSGNYLAEAIKAAGHQLVDRQILADDIYAIRAVVSGWIADPNVQVILTTGGTGFYKRDVMPEALEVLFDKRIDGFGELFRSISAQEIGTSTIQSRALAGMANQTGIFCLPGSTGACRTAWCNIIAPQLDASTKPCNLVPHLLGLNPSH